MEQVTTCDMESSVTAQAQEYYTFDDMDGAIEIHRPDTPAPWINYLSNGRMHAFVSQAGGGFAWWRSPVIFRLTRYRMHHLPIDSPGFYLYLRLPDGTVWSPTFRPCETPLDAWSARHYPGYTRFTARKGALTAELTLFVAPDTDALVWDLRLCNDGEAVTPLDVFAYVELSQLGWQPEQLFGYYLRHMLHVWHDAEDDTLLYLFRHDGHPRLDEVPLVYFTATKPLVSYAGDRNGFLGDYRDERNPLGVERGNCGNLELHTGEPCGALHVTLTLTPGQEERVSFLLGVSQGALRTYPQAEAAMRASLAALRAPGAVDAQFAKLQDWWREHLGLFNCTLPDPDAQRMIAHWSPVNSVQSARYSRAVNTEAPGIRGIGFRDTAQDMLAIAYRKPAWAADTLALLLSQQYTDGHVVHTFFPEERDAPGTSVHSDDHLWPPLLAHALVAETGDTGLLQRRVPYLADDHRSAGPEATLWEHLLAAIRFTEAHLGAHGLPLTLRSDWNDIIGKFARQGRGESIFAGQQYVVALRGLLGIARAMGDAAHAEWLADCLQRQQRALLDHAWDGGWWRRGYDDDGQPVGSVTASFGRLFLNPQSWAIISGVGDPAQWRAGMDAVYDQLQTPVGLKKLHPGFATWPEETDPFSGYAPGCGENGAIFCQANTWAIMAEALLGRGARAWQYYRQLVPHVAAQTVGIKRYQAEPYAWASNIVGPDNPRFGWANVSQITGTAAWMDVAATQYLLGVRPELDRLRIDPVLPPDWPRCTVERVYRGCRLTIQVENPQGVEHGVTRLTLDGQLLDLSHGPCITLSLLAGKTSATVQVTLGKD